MSAAIQQMIVLLLAMGATGAIGYLVARETFRSARANPVEEELRRLKRRALRAEADCTKLRSDLTRAKRAAR